MVSILENANFYKKNKMYEIYERVCVRDYLVDYDCITRKEMIEEIIEQFTPEYIREICTSWEIKALKRLLRNQDLEDERYEFAKNALSGKLLYFDAELPVEFKENVRLAVKDFDLDEKVNKDENILAIIGCVRCFGIIEPTLVKALCQAVKVSFSDLLNSPLFNYWVYLKEDYELIDGSLAEEFVFWDYQYSLYAIRRCRIEHERYTPKFLSFEQYVSFFYHGYDSTNSAITRFFRMAKKEIKNFLRFKSSMLQNIVEGHLGDDEILEYPLVYRFSESLRKAYYKAILQIQTPSLYGMSLQDYDAFTNQIQFNQKLKQLNQVQTNAHLGDKECKQFYKLYFGLLDYVNKKLKVIPNLRIAPGCYIKSEQIVNVVHEFWKDKDRFIDEYCKENPAKLTHRNLNIIQNFKYGIRGIFVLAIFEQNYTVFNEDGINYMVKGLYDNLDNIIDSNQMPMIVETTLLPFQNQIIYDGLLTQADVSLGPNHVSRVYKEYTTGQKIYSLIPKKMQ